MVPFSMSITIRSQEGGLVAVDFEELHAAAITSSKIRREIPFSLMSRSLVCKGIANRSSPIRLNKTGLVNYINKYS